MAKLKTPEEVAPLVREYLLTHWNALESAEPARRIALAFKTNINNIKAACSILRSEGMLIGIRKRGYYAIETIEEWRVAMNLYKKRLESAQDSFNALAKSGVTIFSDDAIGDINYEK